MGILANKLLRKRLAPKGYYECKQTPGLWHSLWRHVTRPISFTLVVDDFGVNYTNKADVDHLIKCLKENYDLTQDWDGELYCGIKLKWNYDERTLDISMPGYIVKQLQKYKHDTPTRPQHCPYSSQPNPDEIKHIQRVIGSILYYARAVDLTVLMALSTIASKQTHGMENTMRKTKQLLDYLATHLEATVRFHASDMVLNIHSDASYLLEANAHSRACGHFFMEWKADPTKPIKLNGHFLHCVQFYGSSSRPPRKQNSEHYSSIANKQQFFDSRSKKWDTPNHQRQYTVIIQPRWALRITQ